MTAIHVVVTGRVQGVGYRAWVLREARARGLAGWVRNRSDGSVEAVFAGGYTEVRSMAEACHQGPPAARVTGVQMSQHPDEGQATFEVWPTL